MKAFLLLNALSKLSLGFLLISILIFLPAGTIQFFYGWLFIAVLFAPMLCIGIILLIKNPELLEKRLNSKEKNKSQSLVVKASALMFVVGFVISGLDFRFQWSNLPKLVSIIATVLFLLSYLFYWIVAGQNPYLSRVVEIQDNQRVIDTGLYSVVRHPMYTVTLFMFLSVPFILGSVYSFFIFLLYPAILVIRINDEEALLKCELVGYSQYMKKVKYRLIPFVW